MILHKIRIHIASRNPAKELQKGIKKQKNTKKVKNHKNLQKKSKNSKTQKKLKSRKVAPQCLSKNTGVNTKKNQKTLKATKKFVLPVTSSTKLAEIQITIRELNSRKTKRKSIKHVQTPSHFPSPFRFVLFSGFWRTAFPSSLFYKKSSKCRKSFYLSFTMRFVEESSTQQSISIRYSLTPCSDRRKHKSKLSVLLMCLRSIPRHQNFP